MKLSAVFTLCLLVSCGRPTTTVDPAFTDYVNSFETATSHSVKSGISFGDAGQGNAGFCNFSQQQIQIDQTAWDSFGPDEREELIFHELGHCDFQLTHNLKKIAVPEARFNNSDEQEPESLMYPVVLTAWLWHEHRAYYVQQLIDAAQANHVHF
jgi:hypothetical protein